ncbi:hypothetical protein ABB37_03325 [Leptomonas pyrrhocoris]|uniref:Uncharacterized protein n=1 Tax=Leptomonas pyrrhocoris TaxID=157538 RepID=A0A0M9G4P0_LEPPY|nr:hypothetical protein ABB37_03325 [Leptomonas pyrrhocoris]KPA82203.1 hypothetical protein ABB37_03325 [Leptomonas pyrrhocoris]|eukprot:XP_015660642.1 hypothetical protein ABB37_03325 [Leptomonas pyrrhocoris]
MTAASQEMADLLREVQKLQKELQPVRSAVAALQKRESETPNPAAAGASLHKVAARLAAVKHKYEPFLARLQQLVADEVPAFLQQTPLLAMGEEAFEAKAATDAGQDTGAGLTPAAARSSTRSAVGEANPSTLPAQEDAARLLREVCPPSIPHLLQPENLRFTQQQLRLRAEMVEYLIATDRLAIADHVARSYGLPVQWFPRLVALRRERTYGDAAVAHAASTSAAAAPATNGVHSPTAGLHAGAPTPMASPLVMPPPRPRDLSGGGVAPKSPIQLPPSSAPARPGSASATPTRQAGSPAGQTVPGASESFTALPPSARPPQQRDGQSPSVPPTHRRGSSAAVEENGASAAAAAAAAAGTSSPSAATAAMPDLVARVISAAMFLKDDYMDRMVLERTLEQSVGLVSAPQSPTTNSDAESAHRTLLEQYKTCVLSRIAHIPRQHLHTQSGDPVFDSVMMNVIEDLLVYGLQRWAEDDTGVPDASAEVQRGVEVAEALAAETKKRKAELLRTLTTDTFLTAEEMLLADKVWSEDVLFLKRPTRFYCVETGLSTDESAGPEGTAPRARATGEVISQLVAEAEGALDATTGIFIT